MTKTLLQLYGLKWNPFAPDVPTEALLATPRIESFGWRVEHLAREGGFAAVVRRPRHRQVGHPPPARRAPRGAARCGRRRPDAPAGRRGRFLSRARPSLRRRAQPPQSLGRREGAARHLARAHRGGASFVPSCSSTNGERFRNVESEPRSADGTCSGHGHNSTLLIDERHQRASSQSRIDASVRQSAGSDRPKSVGRACSMALRFMSRSTVA